MPEVKVLFNELNAFIISIALFGLFSNLNFKNNILVNIGKQSLVIYLLHTYFVTAIKFSFIKMHLCTSKSAIIIVLITWIIPTFISYEIALLSKKNKILEFIFNPLGKKKQEMRDGYN